MTDPDTLAALVARVEQAAGPDRELDVLISVAVGRGDEETHVITYIPEMGLKPQRVAWRPNGLAGDVECRRYTASLDAAVTLVPEGAGFVLSAYGDGTAAFATITVGTTTKAATPALALVAAALRARMEGGA